MSTWRPAYFIEKDILKAKSEQEGPLAVDEDGNSVVFYDPVPTFTSVEQRMLDLSEKRLHPFYRLYQPYPKKRNLALPERPFYQTRSGPVKPDEIPTQCKIKKELFEGATPYAKYKRAEMPQQLVAKIVEMKRNEKPTMEHYIKLKELQKKEQEADSSEKVTTDSAIQ